MARIFLSHSSADEREAVALNKWMADNGWDDVFLDIDPKRGLAAGDRWQEALRLAADRCEAVVFIVSPAWAESTWCKSEFMLAKILHKQIFGVVLKAVPIGELPTEMTSEWQLCQLIGTGPTESIRFRHRDNDDSIAFLAEGLGRLKSGLKKAGLSADFFPWPPQNDPERSPFRGLEPLDFEDAAVFFGRDLEILRALDVLRGLRDNPATRLFVILAASGTGKSSFLRAGLLPRLARDDWHFFPLGVIRPETAPISGGHGLVQSLARTMKKLGLSGSNPGDLKAKLSAGAGEFASILRNIQEAARTRLVSSGEKSPAPTLVLPVDQAEELFNADAGAEARKFLSLIAAIVRDARSPADASAVSLIVAFTIRTDRYEPLQTDPELAGLQTTVFDDLKPMSATRFREVITGPAQRVSAAAGRLEIEPALVERLVEDCATGADTLPLLGLTLKHLYSDFGNDGDLRLDEYLTLGGLESIINNQMKEVLLSDPEIRKQQLALLRTAFIPWLVTINPQNDEPMRRVARTSDLPPESLTLLNDLAKKRLLTCGQRHAETVFEVAHEALLRQWDVLAGWLRDERAALKEADALERQSREWKGNKSDDSWLWGGQRLQDALALAGRAGFRNRLAGCAEFLECSRKQQEEREAEKARIQAEKLKAAEDLAAAQAAAREQAEKANERNLRTLHEASMADCAVAVQRIEKEGKWGEGVAHLVRALKWEPDNPLSAARLYSTLSLHAAEKQTWPRQNLSHQRAVKRAQFSPDGSRIVTASMDNTAQVWDAATGKPLGEPVLHGSNVVSARFSADGTRIVTASEDSTARVWDAATGKPVGEPLRHEKTKNVWSAQFSPDGSRIVTASEDCTARVWDAATGQPLGEPLRHKGSVFGAQFSPDGTRIVTASSDSTARVWDAATGQPLGEPLRHEHDALVFSAQFNPDGTRIVTASSDSTARAWDAATGQPFGKPLRHEHKNRVYSAQFSPDGTRIVTASEDHTARVWDAATGKPLGEPLRHEDDVRTAQFSPDGSRIVTASDDNTVRIWDAATGQPLGESLRHEKSVSSAQFSPDGSRIVTASGNTARVWDAPTGQPLGEPLRLEDGVGPAQFSPDGSRIVIASGDTARVWDAATGKPLGERLRHEKSVSSARFSPDGSRIVTASSDSTARVWDAATGNPLGESLRHEHEAPVWSAQFSPDGTRIITAGMDEPARIWDAATARPVGEPLRHKGSVFGAQFSPDGTRIVTASSDSTARVWDAATGNPLVEPLRHEHEALVLSAQFSPDGTRIVTASSDSTARVWDAATGRLLGQPLWHDARVSSARFSPDGTRIVTASEDNTARVWDAITGRQLGEPLRHEGHVTSAQFSRDGTRIITASIGNAARVWDAVTGKQLGEPLRHEKSVFGAQFSPDGTRILTTGGDKTARVWDAAKLIHPPIPVPEWMREWASAVAGLRFTPDGELVPIPGDERIASLRMPTTGSDPWSVLARWLVLPAAERTVTPDSRFTCRQLAERERDTLLGKGFESALHYDPTVPLARLLLAGALLREDATKKPDERDPSLPQRAAFLRDYDLQRMPGDPVLWERAVRALHDEKEEGRARRALEKLAKLEPEQAAKVRKELGL
ncbi:MAG: hypothetical protein QOE70_2940 [Chthoniobacter sp.]|jgi:WD40 repeat protein|nr:hypothetical protein [Chthoniobacter sp.]